MGTHAAANAIATYPVNATAIYPINAIATYPVNATATYPNAIATYPINAIAIYPINAIAIHPINATAIYPINAIATYSINAIVHPSFHSRQCLTMSKTRFSFNGRRLACFNAWITLIIMLHLQEELYHSGGEVMPKNLIVRSY